VREVSLEILRNLESQNNIYILFREININGKNKTTEAGQILARFGDKVINKLLNIVRDSNDSKERIRIIHIIEDMGHAAIPAIKASIAINAPWYYLRNMAYILGRIGNETSADALRALLLHKDKRIRKEALKSLGQTGGNKRGPLLLSFLPQAEDELRVNVIEMLGKIRCTEAVPNLLDMLKNKSLIAKDEQISLQEKICSALGAIGSPEAIKTLSEIAESKSFLSIRSYPEEVKHAANSALADIKRKQEENQS
jgi:HEAT repeat protein